jgi:hypothetical protein
MLLLDLPRDILLEILDRLWEDTQANTGHEEFITGDCSMIRVGATCRTLRIAALPYIYSDLSLSSSKRALCKFLNEYKHLTAYVRKLTFSHVSAGLDEFSLHDLLRSVVLHCTGLQQLRIECYCVTTFNYPALMILGWLPSESRQSLEYLDIRTDLADLLQCSQRVAKWSANKDFCKLQDLKLYGHFTPEAHDVIPNEVGSEILPQVRKLWLEIRTKEPERVGVYFAKMLPNVESLYLDMSRKLVYTVLSTYVDLKTNITVLHINESATSFADITPLAIEPYHLCELIPKFSRRLTKFTISADMMLEHSPFCHRLFKDIDDWPLLVELKLRAAVGCVGLKPDLLHSAMTELARTHPEATMLLEQSSDIIVNFRPKGPKYIAPVEVFERLCTQSIDQPHPYFSDGDEFDDDHDFDLDIEDAMEEYAENESYEDDYEVEEYDDFWVA